MSSAETFVVIGAGLAGGKAVEALRAHGFSGRLVMVGAEAHRPYERPPLSKGFLIGTTERDKVFLHADDWYGENDIELQLGRTVEAIDRVEHRISLDDGSELPYDKLLLTTGASPRRLPVAGADASGVHYLRTLDDSTALRQVLQDTARLAIIGAGWIGLEVGAAARQAGVEVSVIESATLPLSRILGPEVAQVFADLHLHHGVNFHFNAAVSEIATRSGKASGVTLGDGTFVGADAVLVAVGAAANTQLPQRAGLTVDNGVVVDAGLRSSDPDVFAAGDVANALYPFYGTHLRVEHWANALNQPPIAAEGMLGQQASYDQLPYFYTDQYDLGMEYVGYVAPGDYDQIVFRGDVEGREVIAFWLKDGRVHAGMNVNVWDVVDDVKALIRSRERIDPARLADTGESLTDLISRPESV